MRLILDTHIALWALAETGRLPQRAQDLLIDPANEKLISIVSLWEVAIKTAARRGGPGAMPLDAKRLRQFAADAGLRWLSIELDHVTVLETLLQTRHRDPFDRMLVAQAIAEKAMLLTHDAALAPYGEHIVEV